MKKKVLVVLIVAVVFFSGCSLNKNNAGNTSETLKTKIVRIESNPGGAIVFIDNDTPIKTPADVELTLGAHCITFRKEGYENFTLEDGEVKEDTTIISATLKPLPAAEEIVEFGAMGPIVFDSVPHFACCSAAAIAYSNIFYGGIYTVSGATVLDSFDIVFPSGKTVHFGTEKVSNKVRKFSKVVTFDELGNYEIISNGEHEYSFGVRYKPTLLTPKTEDIFPGFGGENTIAVPVGHEVEAKVLITDAKGNKICNKDLGIYGLKTDDKGIVIFKIKVKRPEHYPCFCEVYVNGQEAEVRIYADLLVRGYDYAKFTRDGKLLESTTKNADVTIQPSLMPWFKDEAKVVTEGSHVYMPYGSFGLKVREIYLCAGRGGNIISPHPKDNSVIYTNAFVSKDNGKTFEKLGSILEAFCVDPKNPAVVFGWSRNSPDLLKSTDYGLHFEKISNIKINLMNNFVEQVVMDPSDPNKIYLATAKGLYVSQDGGSHFELLGENPLLVYAVTVSPQNPRIIIVSSGRGILRSEDGGKTWSVVKENRNYDSVKNIVFDPSNSDVIYAGSQQEGLIVSDDCGKSWKSLKEFNNEVVAIAINPLKHNVMYVAVFRDGIYKSEDYGKSFRKLDFPVGEETSLAFDNKGNLFLIDSGVIYVLSKSGKFVPLDGDRFLIGGPDWKIIDGEFFIDVSGIRGEIVGSKVGENYIEFYEACDMVP